MNGEKQLRFTFQSCADLNAIWEAIAAPNDMWGSSGSENLSDAEAFSKTFEKLCKLLTEYPEVGSDRADLHPGIRSLLFQKYLMFYRVRGEYVEVVRVLGAARDVDLAVFA